MSLRIRESGEVVCAAMHPAMPGDVYVHDGVSYELTVEHRLLVTDCYHLRKCGNAAPAPCTDGTAHASEWRHGKLGYFCPNCGREDPLDGHGIWWWRDDVPAEIELDRFGKQDVAIPIRRRGEGT